MRRSTSRYDKTSALQALTCMEAIMPVADLRDEVLSIQKNALLPTSKSLAEITVKTARRTLAYRSPSCEHIKFGKDSPKLAVVGCDVWASDVIIRYHVTEHQAAGGGARCEISDFSEASRSELRHFVCNSETVALGMITLTYPSRHPVDGRVSKSHLDNFFRSVRRQYSGQFEYLWFMEFQIRGAPHYHILTAGSIHEGLSKTVVHLKSCVGRCGVSEEKPWGNRGYQPPENGKRRAPNCRLVYRGAAERLVVDSWLRAIDSENNDAAVAFNSGGIWEPWHNAQGYAKYVAKETNKTWQKEVPPWFRNCGRFWSASHGWHRPACLHTFTGTSNEVRRYLGIEADAALFPTLYGIAKTIKQPTLWNHLQVSK